MQSPLDTVRNRIAVLVVSCDRYADLWPPFFQLFFRFWPDRPFPVYLLSNAEKPGFPEVSHIPVGDDISWSDNLMKAIAAIREDYLLMFLDDLFLVDYVRTDRVLEICAWIADHDANYVRLNPSEPPDQPYSTLLGTVSPGMIYRTSTVLSVWKKSVLRDLLKSGETAWQFEIAGSQRADRYDSFYSTFEGCFPVRNGVIKGKWDRRVLRRLHSLGVPVDQESRPRMTCVEAAVFSLRQLRSRMLHLVPAGYRRAVRHHLRSMTITNS
jgi:hypothetical protein